MAKVSGPDDPIRSLADFLAAESTLSALFHTYVEEATHEGTTGTLRDFGLWLHHQGGGS